jgi:ribosomal protein S18 acetylase RimI-like enzyme
MARTKGKELRLRPEIEADEPFLRRLFADVRGPEFALMPMDEEQRRQLIIQQFDLQRDQYRRQFPDAQWLVVEKDGAPIGRLYHYHQGNSVHIIDISLLARQRGRGIGARLLRDLQTEARSTNRMVTLRVRQDNPARHLYDRLGFRELRREGHHAFMAWPVAFLSA